MFLESVVCVLVPFELLFGFVSVFWVSFECYKWFVCIFGWFGVVLAYIGCF
ncbi:hypothetical protein E2C01_046279 [Portunus trituberculatus]|uniref:Uncharacterized protein n=1 Tax=Portunus trituberculatus TaxID=210409 RepID=A0A5B7FXF6_PORTR|nr:hypothetical protein [Portunus trituberculatus]